MAEVAKKYWVEESNKVPVVAKFIERLKILNNCGFAEVPKLNQEIADNKILPYQGRADKKTCGHSEINKSVLLNNIAKVYCSPLRSATTLRT